MSHVFISYSHIDQTRVNDLADKLRATGFSVWQDVTGIPGGSLWREQIQKGINEAGAVVVCWSSAAAASTWVGEEIQLAIVKGKPIIPYRLDDTPLSDDLTLRQALHWSSTHAELFKTLPPDLRRRRLGFDATQRMDAHANAETWEIDADHALTRVPLLQSSYCAASVIAPPDAILKQPDALYVCLQYFREVDKTFISEVYRHWLQQPEGAFVGVHVTAPTTYDNKYWLDDHSPAMWLDAIDTAVEAVRALSETRKPTLHIFAIAPNVLMYGIGQRLYRFWTAHLYNRVGTGYVRVYTLHES